MATRLKDQFDWKSMINVDAPNFDLDYVIYNILTGIGKNKEQYENWRKEVLSEPLP